MSRTGSDRLSVADLAVRLPSTLDDAVLDQDEEWCEVLVDGRRQRIRFHDYDLIFEVPGLYERLFHDLLECDSPRVVSALLGRVLTEQGGVPRELRVLDVGAGNGIVAAQLRALGAATVIGIDILAEAAAAARRDRPTVYDDYLVADLTALTPDQRDTLRAADLNAMTTVAALGFGDLPPAAFAAAFNLLATPALLAFNIKEDFVGGDDASGFARLIRRMFDEGVLVELASEHHRHRLSMRGEPIHYVAYVARRCGDVPADWLAYAARDGSTR